MSPGKNIEFFRQIPKRLVDALENLGPGALGCVASPLVETTEFGTNPGNLRMLSFVPEILQPSCALVVVLHGCGQFRLGYGLVDSRRSLWFRVADARATTVKQPQQMFQLVQSARYQAREW
jgi:poly(3-hydroxybutyrate) depolymerase